MDPDGQILGRLRIDTGAQGFVQLMELLAEHTTDVRAVPVAIETDKNLLVVALQGAGLVVHARALARYRERHGQAGKKSDPGDAALLADVLRTDRHQHRPLPATTDEARAVRALARQHQEATWALQMTMNRLRSVLLEFHPQALIAFPNLRHKAALAVIGAAPTPALGKALNKRKVVALLRGCGRRNDPTLVEQILRDLHADALRQPAPVELALGNAVLSLMAVLTGMHTAVERLEQALSEQFDQHPLAPVLRSAPGLGPLLGARVLAEIGDDPARFTSAAGLRAFAGTAPVTRASGRSRLVRARHIRNKRLADACHWWAFAMLTKSAGARAHYDRRRDAGDHHNAALRNLANKLLGRLWWCLQDHKVWDDNAAWPHLQPSTQQAAA